MSSADMVGRTTQFRVKAGSRATLQLTVADSSGSGKNLANTTTYATGKWKVWKPGGTLIINGDIVYTRQVFCADGHPHVYYYIDEESNTAVCGYCNRKWRYVEASSTKKDD